MKSYDCVQRVQTSITASNLNQKWSGIQIQIISDSDSDVC